MPSDSSEVYQCIHQVQVISITILIYPLLTRMTLYGIVLLDGEFSLKYLSLTPWGRTRFDVGG